MDKRRVNDIAEKGITLVELMVVSAIILIVLSLGYLLYFFEVKNFDLINSQTEIQRNARLADEMIRKELRNALKISSESYEEARQIKLEEEQLSYDNSLFLDIKGISNIKFNAEEGSKILSYEILGDNESFKIKNTIFLNNTSITKAIFINLKDGDILYYSKIEDIPY